MQSEIMDRYEKQGITIAGGYDQVLNAREYFLLNHFPASKTVQGATITPVHKIYGQVVGVATEERTDSIYMDYLSGQLTGEYTPEQYFDLYLYDNQLGFSNLPETPAFTQISRLGELFLEASYRKTAPVSENEVEIRYQYGREGVAGQVFYDEAGYRIRAMDDRGIVMECRGVWEPRCPDIQCLLETRLLVIQKK